MKTQHAGSRMLSSRSIKKSKARKSRAVWSDKSSEEEEEEEEEELEEEEDEEEEPEEQEPELDEEQVEQLDDGEEEMIEEEPIEYEGNGDEINDMEAEEVLMGAEEMADVKRDAAHFKHIVEHLPLYSETDETMSERRMPYSRRLRSSAAHRALESRPRSQYGVTSRYRPDASQDDISPASSGSNYSASRPTVSGLHSQTYASQPMLQPVPPPPLMGFSPADRVRADSIAAAAAAAAANKHMSPNFTAFYPYMGQLPTMGMGPVQAITLTSRDGAGSGRSSTPTPGAPGYLSVDTGSGRMGTGAKAYGMGGYFMNYPSHMTSGDGGFGVSEESFRPDMYYLPSVRSMQSQVRRDVCLRVC